MSDLPRNYPKYQFSIFPKGSKDQQLVIRTDTFEELKEAKKNIDKILDKVEKKTPGITTASTAPSGQGLTCLECGGEAIQKSGEKNGKKWSGIFCQDNQDHVKWN